MPDANRFVFLWFDIYLNALLDPIVTGAVIVILSRVDSPVGSLGALWSGVKNWFNLFAARLFAGLIILVGMLCGIVPGILLMVRYGLLDIVVVLEKAGQSTARRRSTTLTRGRRRPIFMAQVLFLAGLIGLPVLLESPLYFFKYLDVPLISILLDCLLELFYPLLTIVMLLFYREAA